MNNFNYKRLPPFKWFILENFPFIEADFDALTEWQLLCKLGNELSKVVNATNTLGTQVETLTDYVSNYFDNLDVQEEINNKLDEMAESGELTDIIAQYLELAGILAFNTVSNMANAQNLANGSFARTYGKLTYNDGLGAYYKIRTLTSSDVIDGNNIVALANYPTLIAEKMPDANIDSINTKIGNLSNLDTTNKTNLVGAINEVNEKATSISVLPTKPLGMKKVIIIGDSYASRENNWVTTLVSLLGLSSSEYYKSAIGSSGFVQQGQQNKTFLTLLTDVIDTLTTVQKAEITHVIVCGGANDNTHEETDIKNAITTFVNTVNSNLPNARTLIGEIGWTNIPSDIVNYGKVVDVYSKCTVNPKCYYLNNVQYTLHNYDLLLSDGVHPTADGNIALASNIHQAIMTGSCEVIYSQFRHKLNENDSLKTFYESLNNNITKVYSNRTSYVVKNFGNVIANGTGTGVMELTDNIFKYAKGSYYESNRTFIVANLLVNGTRRDVNCTIGVYEGKLKLYPLIIKQDGSYETLTNVTAVWLPQFNIVMDSLQC